MPKKRILKVKQPSTQAIEDQQKQLEKMVRQLEQDKKPQVKLSPLDGRALRSTI